MADNLEEAIRNLASQGLTRRQFIVRAAALGLSMGTIGAMLSACGSSATPAATETAASAGGSTGGGTKVFRWGRYMDSINPDPVMNDANASIWYMQQYYSGLLRFKSDLTVEGDLAEKWEVSPDGLTYTFNLRPGVKFADGSPVTAADWQWSLERAKNPDNGIWGFTLDAVDTITTSDTQVVFKLKDPYVPFIYSAALFNASVMPKALVEKAGGWENFMSQAIGTGPYIMKEWVKQDHMTLVRNPNYWDTGKPIIDEIQLKYMPDDATRILALQKGDVDGINFVPPNRAAELKADANIQMLEIPSTVTKYIVLNTRTKPFDNVKIRQALAMSIDRDALIKTVNFGFGSPATTFRPKGSLYHNDTLPGWPLDIEKAKQLLSEAGASNLTTTLQIAAGNDRDLQMATVVKDMWAKAGVNCQIQQVESGAFDDNYMKNNFEATAQYWSDDIPDPSEEVNYACVFATSESFHTGFQSAEIDQLAADALKETDEEKRKQMYFRIQEIMNDQVPLIPLFSDPFLVAIRKNVKNFVQTPLGTYIWRELDIA